MTASLSRWHILNNELANVLHNGIDGLPDAIAALYSEIAATFEPELIEFESFTEAMLRDPEGERAGAVADGEVRVIEGADPRDTLLDAARLLRALEQNAVEISHYLESDIDNDLETAWRTADGRHYVVPRITALTAVDGKPFLRRALLHHRIIPTQIEGFAVRLHRSTMAAETRLAELERTMPPRAYGAALFPGLEVTLAHPDPDSFTVEGLRGFDAETRIAEHLRAARTAGCSAIIWGELTMPEASVAQVRAVLADGALDGHPAYRYLVVGSWHRLVDGRMRNVAQILDGLGEPLFDVLKWAKFSIGAQREAIVPGDEVHVLICEDELMVCAICRDFLQSTCDVPYRKLNVDVAIVPSMVPSIDDVATLRGHAETANVMRVRFGTRTMVVAQPAVPGDGVDGQLLAFPAKPAIADATHVVGAWHVCVLENS